MEVSTAIEVRLPCGLPDLRGRRHRTVAMTPVTGRAELAMAQEANPFRGALRLLAGSVRSLGPHSDTNIHLGLLGGLLPLD